MEASMTINVSITTEFALRLLFFVHEDQEQIIFLLVETFTYLSVAESFKKKIRESCYSSCLGKD